MFHSVVVFLIFSTYKLFIVQTNAEFTDNFGTDTLFPINGVPQRAPDFCRIQRFWDLTTSWIPDQERGRAAFHVMAKALPHKNANLNSLGLIGAMEQLKNVVVDEFRKTYMIPRIRLLYDIIDWKRNEVLYWIHTSGDVAAVLTGQLLYAEYYTKNRDINGYYVAENPFKYAASTEARLFEETPHFKAAYEKVNSYLQSYFETQKTFSNDETVAAYDLCRHAIVTFHVDRERISWCKGFTEAELEVYEFHEELNLQHGAWHNSSDLGPNVCGIVDSMESTIIKEKDGLIGTTFFSVTQQFLPFLDALKLLNRNLKSGDFEKRNEMKGRIKKLAGRIATLTVFKYNPECKKKQTEIFVNNKRQEVDLKSLVAKLKQTYKCHDAE